MDIASLIGLALGCGAVLVSVFFMGGLEELRGFLSLSAIILVAGGALGATILSFPLSVALSLPKLLLKVLMGKTPDPTKVIELISELTRKARKEGVLALEEMIPQIEDRFLREGVQMIVDGLSPEVVKEVLTTEIEATRERHRKGQEFLMTLGSFSPAFGMIGTVMGLVSMLRKLSDPASMGPAIAQAFLTTLYGVIVANIFFIPAANKLRQRSDDEIAIHEMILRGLLALQAGDNPRIVQQKMISHLPPKLRKIVMEEGERRPEGAEAASSVAT